MTRRSSKHVQKDYKIRKNHPEYGNANSPFYEGQGPNKAGVKDLYREGGIA